MPNTYNVYAVNIKTGEKRLIAKNKSERSAETIVDMAAIRRGVNAEYFMAEPIEGE